VKSLPKLSRSTLPNISTRIGRGARLKVAFLVFNIDGMGGTSRSVITQANALAARDNLEVRLISVTRSADRPHYEIHDAIAVDYLCDVRGGQDKRPSRLIPPRWDGQFFESSDEPMIAHLTRLNADVLVTVTPALMAAAVQFVPTSVKVLHQEHRSSADRLGGLEPLLAFAPRVAALALLTESTKDWLQAQLGRTAPRLLVMPNPLPLGEQTRSRLDSRTIVGAGRIVHEKQFQHVIRAFDLISADLDAWRVRILGEGNLRQELIAHAAKYNLTDRVELPGAVRDMRPEWAGAAICVLSSLTEGFPLVAQEAMSAGVPVVTYDCPSGPRELVEHEVSGLLVGPGSRTGLANALRRLATDDELRARLGEGAYAASRRYAPDLIAARWEQIFTELTTGSTDPSPTPAASPPPFDRQQGPTVLATPLEVRRESAALIHDALNAVAPNGGWFAIPDATTPRVCVPTTARSALLAHLGEHAPEHLSLLDPGLWRWPRRRAAVSVMAQRLSNAASTRLELGPWPRIAGQPSPLAEGGDVAIEFWEPTPEGNLVAPYPNPWTTTVPVGSITATLSIAGIEFPTLPAMARPTVEDVTFPIDVVYTWVNGDDPAWQAARAERTGGETRRESAGAARFRSRDELRFSMRSIHAHAPWVRTIHLVTMGQRPDWLADDPRVRLVDHHDILPAEALPTFNSQAIETSLHRIPDLAEHFIYVNDDVFLARPARPENFFAAGGDFAAFLSDHTIGLPDAADRPFLQAAHNNRRLLEEAFGVTINRVLAHSPHPHRVSVLKKVEERFSEAVAATARAPFRSPSDVSLLSSLAQHYGLITGQAYVGDGSTHFVDLTAARLGKQFAKLRARNVDFFCLGDHHDFALDTDEVDTMLADFLAEYFPVSAPWER
jgi:glycosyltransferase involved in cell wall biosynthesis